MNLRDVAALAVRLRRRDDRIRRTVAALEPPVGVDPGDPVQLAWWRRLRIDALTAQRSCSADDWLAYLDARDRFTARYGEPTPR